MNQLGSKALTATLAQQIAPFIMITVVAWFFLKEIVLVLGIGALGALLLTFIEWLIVPSLVSSLFQVRWMERVDDPVFWSMVHGEAAKAGVKVRKIGVIDSDVPNAFAYSSLSLKPQFVYTKGVLQDLSFYEARAMTRYLIGAAKSGLLPTVTALSGLLSIPPRLAWGYVGAKVKGENPGFGERVSAALSYIPFALTYPQTVMVGRVLALSGDEHCIEGASDPSDFLSALVKSAESISRLPADPLRSRCVSLKSLMFQDPTVAVRDEPAMRRRMADWGIDVHSITRINHDPQKGDTHIHALEKFWPQPGLVERMERAVDFAQKRGEPIKMGLSWIA